MIFHFKILNSRDKHNNSNHLNIKIIKHMEVVDLAISGNHKCKEWVMGHLHRVSWMDRMGMGM